ncbi:hypothetical protein HK096_010631, partial [Nowakowskiella sp. JEL0078]
MSLELVAELKGHSETVWQVCWSPINLTIASCSSDKTIRIWKPEIPPNPTQKSLPMNWACVAVLDDAHKRTIRSIAFAPNGKHLASCSFDSSTAIWEASIDGYGYECIATLEGHENEVKSVSWSSSGALLASCSRDKSVWIWEVSNDSDFECISVLQEHTQDVKSIQWHPTKEILASASYDDSIKIWEEDDDDWYCISTLNGHKSTVWGVDFDASGDYLVSGGDDKSLKVWKQDKVPNVVSSFKKKTKWACVATVPDLHSRTIYAVSWSKHNNLIATSSGDNSIKILLPKK